MQIKNKVLGLCVHFKKEVSFFAKNLPGFTEKEAIILFNTYKVFSFEIESSVVNAKTDTKSQKNTVDVRYFGLFFALQLFMVRTKISIGIDTRDKTPWQVIDLLIHRVQVDSLQ